MKSNQLAMLVILLFCLSLMIFVLSGCATNIEKLIDNAARGPISEHARALDQILSAGSHAVPALRNAVHDPSSNKRYFAITALREIGHDAQPAVLDLEAIVASDPSWVYRELAVTALCQIEDQPSSSMIKSLYDDDAAVRAAGARCLESAGWSPTTLADTAAYLVSRQDWTALERGIQANGLSAKDVGRFLKVKDYQPIAPKDASSEDYNATVALINVLATSMQADVLESLMPMLASPEEGIRIATQKAILSLPACETFRRLSLLMASAAGSDESNKSESRVRIKTEITNIVQYLGRVDSYGVPGFVRAEIRAAVDHIPHVALIQDAKIWTLRDYWRTAKDGRIDREALSWSVALGAECTVRWLLEHGAKATDRDSIGRPVLIIAALYGRTRIVQLLLESGAGVDDAKKDGGTALMTAALYGLDEIVVILLKHGADPNAQGREGYTALMLASSLDMVNMVKLLLNAGAKPELTDKAGKTAIDHAANPEIAEILNRALREGTVH